MSQKLVDEMILEVIKDMRDPEINESLIAINRERLDSIIEESMEDKDRKSAIKAIDTQNKMLGAYTEKVKVESDKDIVLNFKL